MISLLLLGLALRVGANTAATNPASHMYTVSGAGDPIADGVYVATRADAKTFAANGGNAASLNLTIFQHKGRWYIGRSGTGPLLYKGACLSAVPPLEWSASSWGGSTSPAPMPRLAASGGVDALARCHRPPPPAVCDGYTLNGAAVAVANGCYIKVAVDTFRHTTNASLELYRDGEGKWVVGFGSGVDRGKPIYISNCASSILPPACHGWQVVATGQPANQNGQKGFSFSSSTTFPLGYCPPVPPPAAKPHPRCGPPVCQAIWGQHGCPDLHDFQPDLVRPPMLSGVAPAAGKRVRAVAPGFENTLAYHPLYLPSDWVRGGVRKYPIIVEYMANGPFNSGWGDISTGRPEDSNLGWGMAEPAGTAYIWISMPCLSAELGNLTEVSTYWWGCPSSDASRPCFKEFDITPTIRYLHSALNQAFDLYGGDPERVVVTGWSRGAIATGAIGLYDDATSKLFRAFVPYSHLDGDCGWVDHNKTAMLERWRRLDGRPTLYLGECDVATRGGEAYLKEIGLNGSSAVAGMEFRTTGFANHNDAWVLRNSSARAYLRSWLRKVLE